MSVGLLVVLFQYGLYVVVHLSKFVSLFSVFTRSMSAVSCRFTLAANLFIHAIKLRLYTQIGCIGAGLLRMYEYTNLKSRID